MLEAERNKVFESWIDAHKAILFKVARVYGATHSDGEDLFQEIALQLWHSVEAWRGDCEVTTWIYRVALNTRSPGAARNAGTARAVTPLTIDSDCIIHRPPRLKLLSAAAGFDQTQQPIPWLANKQLHLHFGKSSSVVLTQSPNMGIQASSPMVSEPS